MRTFTAGADDSKDDASQKEPKPRGLAFYAVMNSDTIFERVGIRFTGRLWAVVGLVAISRPRQASAGGRAGATPLVADHS